MFSRVSSSNSDRTPAVRILIVGNTGETLNALPRPSNIQLFFRSSSNRLTHVIGYLRGGTEGIGILYVGDSAGNLGSEVCLKDV